VQTEELVPTWGPVVIPSSSSSGEEEFDDSPVIVETPKAAVPIARVPLLLDSDSDDGPMNFVPFCTVVFQNNLKF
jgi:hypothetical protein